MDYQTLHWSAHASLPLLALLQAVPLAAAVAMPLFRRSAWRFALAIGAALAELALALALHAGFDRHATVMQFSERFQVFGAFQYHAAADGISVIFTLLTAFLTVMVILYANTRQAMPSWRFLATVLAVESALMSQLVTVDMLWFTLASGAQLGLIGYLLWGWSGSPDKHLALKRYLQFMGIGLLLLLTGVVLLGWTHAVANGGRWSFDLFTLMHAPRHAAWDSVIFFALLYGLGTRIPLFPLHGWLPATAEHGTIAVAPVLLLGVKAGVHGLLRFVFPLLHEAVTRWHDLIVGFAVAGVFYAAILALMQDYLRRLLAYAIISHTCLLVIGLFSIGHVQAFQGGVLLTLNFGIAITILLFVAGFIHGRTGTLRISRLSSLFDPLPVVGIAFLLASLSIVGMPGTPGFDAVHLMLEASIERFGAVVTILAALGNVIAAGFLLWTFQRAFLARSSAPPAAAIAPATGLERGIAILLIVALLGSGFYSSPWLELMDPAVQRLNALYAPAEAH